MTDQRRANRRTDERRTGVYPGSFNPPTTAHLAIAEAAAATHNLDRIDLAVSHSALAKETVDHPRFEHRIEVLRATVAGHPRIDVTTTRAQLLVEIAAGYDLLVVGADKWWQIQDPSWYEDEDARDRAMAALPPVAVVGRDDLTIPDRLRLPVPPTAVDGISSTRARSGDLDLMTPEARSFAERTGAWVDPDRYDRWLVDGSPS